MLHGIASHIQLVFLGVHGVHDRWPDRANAVTGVLELTDVKLNAR